MTRSKSFHVNLLWIIRISISFVAGFLPGLVCILMIGLKSSKLSRTIKVLIT